MKKVKALYTKAILPEHQGNPFIEGLPQKQSAKDLMEFFAYYPEVDEEIRYHSDPLVREEYTQRLKSLRQPLPIYYDCFRAIETAIKAGYSSKNPFTPTTAQFLHYPVDERPEIEPRTGFFEPKADSITLKGESGVGKTSMLEQLLNYFPQIIEHDIYQGQKMEFTHQVVWIKVDCPNNSSVRELCEEILSMIDSALGEVTKPEPTIPKLMRQIEQKIKSSFLGLLVIDEMQRLVFKRTGGENNLLNFLHSLVNKLGVPLLFCANPPFDKTLAKTLKAARRAESGGYFEMEPLKRDSQGWDYFVHELWDLHWTNVTTDLTDDLNNKLFELSVGNLDLAHRIYRDAQRLVIGSGDERITEAVLEQAYATSCGLSSKTAEVIELRQQNLLPRRNKKSAINRQAEVKQEASKEKKKFIADITRVQHPEFETKLRELIEDIALIERVKDPDSLRKAVDQEDSLDYLRQNDLLLDDPLDKFG
ncbi:ATP-binding protein [Thiomicrorhabdus sp. Kp2]|uniref:ATP-binding protein n=1 Tax=Thiomicrorhabdus sp. Kp2 TaxID=1123518 RepID=UPI0003FF64D3|nr:ATP-binding protein [Thiomicrorhabdus sp. Kp2]